MESAVLSAVVSVANHDLELKTCVKIKVNFLLKYTKNAYVYMILKTMRTGGPRGLSGPTAQSPVDAEVSRGADPATASSQPVLARRSKPAAACR